MEHDEKTGGPAFPAMEVRTHDTGDIVHNASQGITVRDYFAASASEEDIAEHINGPVTEQVVTDNGLSRIVSKPLLRTREEAKYAYADAMLKARGGAA